MCCEIDAQNTCLWETRGNGWGTFWRRSLKCIPFIWNKVLFFLLYRVYTVSWWSYFKLVNATLVPRHAFLMEQTKLFKFNIFTKSGVSSSNTVLVCFNRLPLCLWPPVVFIKPAICWVSDFGPRTHWPQTK